MFKSKLLLLFVVVAILGGCSKVPSGHVGVKVYLLGSDKGVDMEELGVGRYWIGINEELHLFPTFTQNYVWTEDAKEGSQNDESFTFQTVEGMAVGADIGISYAIQPDKVGAIFQKYRKGINEITDTYLRNMVRDALVTAASTKPIKDVYGAGKAALMSEIETAVRLEVNDLGINIEHIYWVGQLRLPDAVVDALNAKIRATEKAAQRVNEVAQTIAEADKAREKAKGVADAILLVATAEAKAIKIKGEALQKNPAVVKLNAIDKWDGVLPKFNGGGAVPFIDVTDQFANR